MAGYYYLMAQLPSLSSGSAPGLSYKDFLDLAGRFLSSSDLKTLRSISLVPPRSAEKTGSSVVDGWYAKERALRLALARVRAGRLKREGSAAYAGMEASAVTETLSASPEISLIAKNAAAMEDPLEAERYLDRERMSFAQELGNGHFFDSEAVFAYAFSLLLREREDSFSVDSGRSAYMGIYNSILNVENSSG